MMMRITQQFAYFCIINGIAILSMTCIGRVRSDDERAFSPQQLHLKNKCLNPPRTARRVETVIPQCQEEVKNKLLSEALQILKVQVTATVQQFEQQQSASSRPPETITTTTTTSTAKPKDAAGPIEDSKNGYINFDEAEQTLRRMRRDTRSISPLEAAGIYHPTLVPMQDKRIAGCLLHCVYAKNNAINKNGWPTLDGLVHFYSEGVTEHGFFMATLRSVNMCLRAVSLKYRVNRFRLPQQGESCDLAFDVFDCIADQITGYCLDEYRY